MNEWSLFYLNQVLYIKNNFYFSYPHNSIHGRYYQFYITGGKTRAQVLGKLPKGYPHSKEQKWGLHPSLISKALNCRDRYPIEADVAESSSFPEQQPIPSASGLRKVMDNRIHWAFEEKNLGEGL